MTYQFIALDKMLFSTKKYLYFSYFPTKTCCWNVGYSLEATWSYFSTKHTLWQYGYSLEVTRSYFWTKTEVVGTL